MEPEVIRYRLKRNYLAILRDLEPKKVLNYLYQEEIFDEDELDEVRSERTRKAKAETLLAMLMRGKGLSSYSVLLEALDECQPHLAEILRTPTPSEKDIPSKQADPEVNLHFQKMEEKMKYLALKSSASPSESFDDQDTFIVKPTNFEETRYYPEELDEVYKMTSSPKGYAVIFNYKKFDSSLKFPSEKFDERLGSDKDTASLVRLWKAYDFEVPEPYLDLSYDETKTAVNKLALKDYSQYDCLAIFLMSHGKEDFIYTSDGGELKINEIRKRFSNALCRSLAGKPKLFFIQACRGEKKDFGTIVQDGPKPPEEHQETPYKFDLSPHNKGASTAEMADFLLAYSTVGGHASFRNTADGSRFIRALVTTFALHSGSEDVLSMLTRVNREVNRQGDIGNKQVSQPETTLTKKLFLWPGLKFE